MKIVLFSGGVDSSTCLGMARECDKNVIPVFINYGQRHNKYEHMAAVNVSEHYGLELLELNLENIFKDGNSSLTDLSLDVSHGDYSNQTNANTEVEFRNGVFLSILASLAMQYGADEIYFGAHKDDSGVIYPDCSPEFISSIDQAINIGTHGKVRVNAPFMYRTKSAIVAYGKTIKVPYELTYSCYEGTYPPCGKCGTCIDRNKAFKANSLDIL